MRRAVVLTDPLASRVLDCVWAGRVVGFVSMTVSRKALVGIALVIFAVTVWLFWPSVHGGFLTDLDDDEYLRQAVRCNGLTWNAVEWAFTCTDRYYQPLARLSHVLDYQIWGKNAAGHHATSVVVHALNAALVFGFLWTLLGAASLTAGERLALALGVAVVFAIHPLQAESVAWMSGRTQLLCTTFGIGCLWAYVAGARRWTVWGLFVVALLCKPMAISFPFVILAMDYYPLRRHEQLGWGRLLREQAAFVAFAVAAGLASLHIATGVGGMMDPVGAVPWSQHVLLMFRSLAFYPFKLVWPAELSPWYPLRLGLSLDQWPVLLSALSVGIVTALAVWYRRRLPALAAGWGAYVVLVLPVSGLMQTTSWAVANRYAYAAMVPLLLLAGGMVIWAWRRGATVNRLALGCLLACELCFFGLRTRSLTPDWRNEETLWRAVLVRFPDFAEAHYNLGVALTQFGRTQEAIAHYEQALRIKPDDAGAHYNLGMALAQTGRIEDAIGHYKQALRIKADYAEAHNNLGTALAQTGRIKEAIDHYEQALRIKADDAEAHNNLGTALAQTGRVKEAIAHFQQALRINPDLPEVHYNLGNSLALVGRVPEAIEHLQQALRIKPDFTQARNALARLQARQ